MIRDPASFRDPSGIIFHHGGQIMRQVNRSYQENYDRLMDSGLYDELVENELLIPHEESASVGPQGNEGYRVLMPQAIDFVSYPYEWCFGQLRDAALTTLRIQKIALVHGLILKDASAYNIQYHRGRPVLIDTLSFDGYRPGEPWVGYRQFCQHFLAPLALMTFKDPRLGQLLRVFIDGVPLDLTSTLLPWQTRGRFSLLTHLHLHAKTQRAFSSRVGKGPPRQRVTRAGLEGIVQSLENAVRKLRLQKGSSFWSSYYEETNYMDGALERKVELIARFLDEVQPRSVWDLGANTGRFSRIASDKSTLTVSMDFDHRCVEATYSQAIRDESRSLLPLLMDLTNPSAGIGWDNRERRSLEGRGPADLVMALALLHHLVIGNNVPFEKVAQFLERVSRALVIEFVPKSDSQVHRMLSSREDVFPEYTRDRFENAFGRHFTSIHREPITGSERSLYLMRSKNAV